MSVATYQDVTKLAGKTILIDVREASEIEKDGTLPHSINIPLGDLMQALSLADPEFKSKYGVDKPEIDQPIIFSCHSGGRACKAAQMCGNLGYNNVRYYKGSWVDFNTKGSKD